MAGKAVSTDWVVSEDHRLDVTSREVLASTVVRDPLRWKVSAAPQSQAACAFSDTHGTVHLLGASEPREGSQKPGRPGAAPQRSLFPLVSDADISPRRRAEALLLGHRELDTRQPWRFPWETEHIFPALWMRKLEQGRTVTAFQGGEELRAPRLGACSENTPHWLRLDVLPQHAGTEQFWGLETLVAKGAEMWDTVSRSTAIHMESITH